MIEHFFLQNWLGKEEFDKYTHPKNASQIINYHQNPNWVIFVGFVSRYSLISSMVLLIINAIVAVIFDLKFKEFPLWNLMCLLAVLGATFTFSMAYLRTMVLCPNCRRPIYHIDDHFNAYFDTAKHAFKDKIIECMHCYATYILNPKMDLEYATKRALEISVERKKMQEIQAKLKAGTLWDK